MARRFTDRYGFSWQVCELPHAREEMTTALRTRADPPADAPARDAGELYFFARGTTLVLRDYPREWSEMTPRELEQLRGGARILGIDATTPIPRQALAAVAGATTALAAPARAMTVR
ncbi:MAG: hypothetical protein U0164_00615 [Gemmatimonadaceae bacterium]